MGKQKDFSFERDGKVREAKKMMAAGSGSRFRKDSSQELKMSGRKEE